MRRTSVPVSRGCARIAGRTRHDPGFFRLEREHQAQCDRGGHVDPQDLNRQDRQGRAQHDGDEDDEALTHVRGQRPHDELRQVVEHAAALFDRGLDRGEVVVGEHHVGGFLGDLGTAATHRHADVGLLERRGVVDPVSGHRDHVIAGLQALDESELLLR